MKYFDWDETKNNWLIKNRGVSFELLVEIIQSEECLDIVQNHPPYEHQQVFIVTIDEYVYRVPFVEDDEKVFLKTAYPSRKETKKYLNK
jgi:uncharacterized DUF497 family protein